MSRYRPWLAAILAFVYPGLGHLYLRKWLRAAGWFFAWLGTLWLLLWSGVMTEEMLPSASGGIDSILRMSRQLPTEAAVSLALVNATNVLDAYLTARRQPADGEADGESCPECGRELDQDLDFCPWCTARFDDGEDESAETETAEESTPSR